jgi:hypothetical protein
MKTIKIFLSVAGFALTSICFGQLLSHNNKDVLSYAAYYNATVNRFEHRVNEFPSRTPAGDQSANPVRTRTYFVPMESDMDLESWMIAPFESSYHEAEPLIEPWMTTPFESGDEIAIESWMTTTWI